MPIKNGRNLVYGRDDYERDYEKKIAYSGCGFPYEEKVGEPYEWYLERKGVARPIFKCLKGYIPNNSLRGFVKEINPDEEIYELEYGYYPQTAPKKELQSELNSLLAQNKLHKNGNSFLVDSISSVDTKTKMIPQILDEYEYQDRRFVKVKANLYNKQEIINGEKYKNGDYVWVEVEPIKWILYNKMGIMRTKNGIISGIQFAEKNDFVTGIPDFCYDDDYRKTNMYRFLDNWEKEIAQVIPKKSRFYQLNPDVTLKEDRRQMTDTEIIHNWIENGESVLLRGPSGIGKTERIRTLYPDLIELKLTNNMFPEKVLGSSNIQTGEEIPPNYATQIILKSATDEEKDKIKENIQNIYEIADEIYRRSRESDDKIVVLLDELLNVSPNIQALVYTLVLNRFVEIGGGIKLPKNVVVVATGNSKKYSNVAENLVKPLEKRFDHILDMKPKVSEWLSEYAETNNVHPAVKGYIYYKYISSGYEDDINEIGYFYEEPEIGDMHLDKYGCSGRTNDPRGWTAISNMLYHFENNLVNGVYEGKDVEDILHRTLESKLRFEWAQEFFDFYNQPVLTPEEVINGLNNPNGYTEDDLPSDTNSRFAFMTSLLSANEKQVEKCREFIEKYCDREYREVYDLLWAGDDTRRQELISEFNVMSIEDIDINELGKYADKGITAYSTIGDKYKTYLMNRDREEKESEKDV